jgi:cytochrome P450
MPLDELAFKLGTSMIDAALEGTRHSLIWFVVGFVAKAREKLDAVVGHDQLPVPDDKPNLPYVTAVVEEIFRWRPRGRPSLKRGDYLQWKYHSQGICYCA